MSFEIGNHIVDIVLAEHLSKFGHRRRAVRDDVFGFPGAKRRRTFEDSVEIGWAKWRRIAGLLVMAADALLFKNVLALLYPR